MSLDFCRDIPGVPKKFEKKNFVFNARPLIMIVGVAVSVCAPISIFFKEVYAHSYVFWCGNMSVRVCVYPGE